MLKKSSRKGGVNDARTLVSSRKAVQRADIGAGAECENHHSFFAPLWTAQTRRWLSSFSQQCGISKAVIQELDATSDTLAAHSDSFGRLLIGRSILMNSSWPSNIADALPS